MLKQNTIKKKQIDENATKLAELNTDDNDSVEYKMKTICNSVFYIRKLASHLSGLYYLIF